VTPTQALSVSTVLESMRTLGERHRPLLVRLTLAFAALSTALVPLQLTGTLGLAIAVGLGLLLQTAYSGMIAALVCLPGERSSAGELWAAIRPVFSSLIWVTLTVAVAIGIGVVLLIVPALILLTIWAVAVQVMVVERAGVFGSLARSRELVRGNGWRVFGFLLVIALITIVVGLLGLLVAAPFGASVFGLAVGNFIVICVVYPLFLGGPSALYNELVRIDGGAQSNEVPEDPGESAGPGES